MALDSSAVEKPAFCRIVHGRPAYIDARTPRVNGANPGNPGSMSATSSCVYNGLTAIPSGVCQVRSRPLTSLAASAIQSSGVGLLIPAPLGGEGGSAEGAEG